MKVLLKSLKELEREFTIVEDDDYLLIDDCFVFSEMIELLGKIEEANYNKEFDSYIIDGWYFHPNLIKGIVINEEITYTIKRLSDGIEYTLSL